MTTNEAPPRVFEQAYTGIVWLSTGLMVAILSWVVWTLMTHSPVGTKRSTDFAASLATRTALAVLVPVPEGQVLAALPAQCQACHMVNGTGGVVGPDLSLVGERAATRFEEPRYTGGASSAAEYLLESIQSPSAYVVEGFNDGIMPQNGSLPNPSPAYLDQIVEYLQTLK